MTSGLMTRKQAAEYLGMSERTLSRLAESGRGPVITRLSVGKIRYAREDLDAYIRDCKEAPCPSTKKNHPASGGAGSKSPGGKYGGQLARQIAGRLRSKSEGSEPTTSLKHLIAVPDALP